MADEQPEWMDVAAQKQISPDMPSIDELLNSTDDITDMNKLKKYQHQLKKHNLNMDIDDSKQKRGR